jgi:HK97 family phage prohead protease
MTDTLTGEERKLLSTADINDLPDSDFAYIEPGGKKDDEGKTVPRSLRHYPIHDAAHTRNALARAGAAIAAGGDEGAIAEKAMPAIKAAAKKFGIDVAENSADDDGELRDTPARKPRHTRELALQTKCRRQYVGNIEVRDGFRDATTGDDLVELRGQVIGYDTPYEVYDAFGPFTETIHRGAASEVLSSPGLDACFLVGHDSSLVPLARTGAKASLTLSETDSGLQVRALVDPRMAGAQELLLGLENGTIRKMSVGMQVDPEGDEWTGEDKYGMPNVRNITKLANIFDVSAVAFPANPNTALELASARMEEFPPEVTARVQHLEQLAKEGRKGMLSQADSDALLNVVRRLFGTEDRAPATNQDSKVMAGMASIGQAIHDTLAAQVKDPDNNTDPKDKKILSGLKDLQAAHANLMHLQAQDSAPDNNAEDGEYQGDPDGTDVGGSGNAPIPDNEDGTGSRTAAELAEIRLRIDQDMLRLNRRPVYVA